MARSWDVIVVGTRAAGAATAMLLARAGLQVLAVDQASFPSDTLSSHQVQVPGIARLSRWGLLAKLDAAGTPPTRRVRFDSDGVVLEGCFPPYDGVDALYSPRRTVLDALLVDAARAAGAEVWENVQVKDVSARDGVVTGISGIAPGRSPITESGRLVIGADGKHSIVARAVHAEAYRVFPASSVACYGYWSGLPLETGELYQRAGLAAAAFPTNDGLTMVFITLPLAQFGSFRRGIKEGYIRAIDRCGDLGERVRTAVLAERLRTTPDLPNHFHVPHGPGWALVGDAGVVMDPVSAQGIGNALQDAESMANAVVAGLGGSRPLASSLQEHWRRRDAAIGDMYDMTMRLASYRPPRFGERLVLRSLPGRQADVDRFLGVFAGTVRPSEFSSPRNLIRLLGYRVAAALGGVQDRPRHHAPAPVGSVPSNAVPK
jgi:2-polyprenyl-6-methoxyphenol hydroxylase-like FAD-dependent oxidoreductase